MTAAAAGRTVLKAMRHFRSITFCTTVLWCCNLPVSKGLCPGMYVHKGSSAPECVPACGMMARMDGGGCLFWCLQVPYAHKDLSSGLDLSGYTNELHEVLSIQSCGVQQQQADAANNSSSDSNGNSDSGLDRLGGRDAAYAFVYPNLMINRYGELFLLAHLCQSCCLNCQLHPSPLLLVQPLVHEQAVQHLSLALTSERLMSYIRWLLNHLMR